MNLYSGIKNYIKNIDRAKPLNSFLPPPRFPPPEERAFLQYYRKKTISAARFALFLSVFLYAVFGLLDRWVVPVIQHKAWLIRYAIVCPLIILSLVVTYLSKKLRLIQLLISLALIVGGIGIAFIMFIDQGYGGEIYYGGLLLVIFGAYTFLKLQFKYAVISAWTVTLVYIILSVIDKKMNFVLLLNNYFFILSANFMGMPVAYVLEAYLRRDYQSTIMLKKAMRQIHRMSIIDELTNVANRRYFDMRFPEEFNRMRRIQHPLSLLVADIDFFKEYNDQFGHQAGDECLVKIAGVLKQCIRRASDLTTRSMANRTEVVGNLVTRWGGEEFVIILSGSSLDSAYTMAEKIRQGVLDLRIPHPASGASGTVTISIGVSSLIPSASNSCEALFKAADTALYRAKESGRNRAEKESCS